MRARYDKQAVIDALAAGKLAPRQIAESFGLTLGNVYTIKSAAQRAGLINSRGHKTLEDRIKDEEGVFTPEIRKRIKDLREKDLTSSDIREILWREGIASTLEDVNKVMARGSTEGYYILKARGEKL